MRLTYDKLKEIKEIWEDVKWHYGKSRYYPWVPTLVVIHDTQATTFAEFCTEEREVITNVAGVESMKKIIQSIIHEYVHYLQHPGWYTRYEQDYGYTKNPYEIEANEIAERDWKLFEQK